MSYPARAEGLVNWITIDQINTSKYIENLIQLGPSNLPQFQDHLKKLHKARICQTKRIHCKHSLHCQKYLQKSPLLQLKDVLECKDRSYPRSADPFLQIFRHFWKNPNRKFKTKHQIEHWKTKTHSYYSSQTRNFTPIQNKSHSTNHWTKTIENIKPLIIWRSLNIKYKK